MKYRKARISRRWKSARMSVITSGMMEGTRYWAVGSASINTIMLYLCAKRGDPFAQRIWAKTTVRYFELCATAE